MSEDPRLLPLLGAVAAGERDALAAIYDLVAPRVLTVVRSLLDDDEDDDCVERVVVETFTQVWRQAPLMAARCPDVAGWVLTVAVRSAADRQSRPAAAQQQHAPARRSSPRS